MFRIRSWVRAEGVVTRFVKCEQCGHGYAYRLKREATKHYKSYVSPLPVAMDMPMEEREDRVATDAEVELDMKLRSAYAAVPCPKCGWYQRHMIKLAREERYGWLVWVGLAAGLVLAFALFSASGLVGQVHSRRIPPAVAGMAAMGLRFLAMLALLGPLWGYLIKQPLAAAYHPNDDDVEERIERGRERSLSPREYARLVGKKPARGTHPKLRPEDLG